MANVFNFGLSGIGGNVQVGKNGPKLVGNASSSTFSITDDAGALTTIQGANAVSSSDLVTKAQLDAQAAGTNGFELELGNISADGDGSWTDGAV